MTINIEKLRNDIRDESRKFMLQLVVAIAASVGAGVALSNWVNTRPSPAPGSQAVPAPAPQRG